MFSGCCLHFGGQAFDRSAVEMVAIACGAQPAGGIAYHSKQGCRDRCSNACRQSHSTASHRSSKGRPNLSGMVSVLLPWFEIANKHLVVIVAMAIFFVILIHRVAGSDKPFAILCLIHRPHRREVRVCPTEEQCHLLASEGTGLGGAVDPTYAACKNECHGECHGENSRPQFAEIAHLLCCHRGA